MKGKPDRKEVGHTVKIVCTASISVIISTTMITPGEWEGEDCTQTTRRRSGAQHYVTVFYEKEAFMTWFKCYSGEFLKFLLKRVNI
jgi:hypothetical protein